jgi:N,N-dimethylformamidase
MTFRLDPSRIDLAREFKSNVYGRHSGDLQRILNLFRSESPDRRYVLIREARHGPWALAQYEPNSRDIPRRLGPVFVSWEDAEWAVFKLRWRHHTGQELLLD